MKLAIVSTLLLAASAIAAPADMSPANGLEERSDAANELDARGATCYHQSKCEYWKQRCEWYCDVKVGKKDFTFMNFSGCWFGTSRCCCTR